MDALGSLLSTQEARLYWAIASCNSYASFMPSNLLHSAMTTQKTDANQVPKINDNSTLLYTHYWHYFCSL